MSVQVQAANLMIVVILVRIGKRYGVKEAKKEKELEDQGLGPKVKPKERKVEEGVPPIVLTQVTTQGLRNIESIKKDQGNIQGKKEGECESHTGENGCERRDILY